MLFKIVTDYVRSALSHSLPKGMSIFDIDGVFVITSPYYSTLHYHPSDVIAIMAQFCHSYCGRIISASFINDGVSNYGNR